MGSTDAYARWAFIKASERFESSIWDPRPIQAFCSAGGEWPKDLVVVCPDVHGGISNARQMVLTCLRKAFSVKGGIVLPTLSPRVKTDPSKEIVNEYGPSVGMGALFDDAKFLRRIKESCPQMQIFHQLSDAMQKPYRWTKPFHIADFKKGFNKQQLNLYAANWTSENPTTKDGKTRLAKVQKPYWVEYEVCQDGVGFANSFGQIIQMSAVAYHLASIVLFELSKRFQLDFNPDVMISPNGFVGVHLRTSKDATEFRWMTYEDQSTRYLQYIKEYKPPLIYVASGNESSIDIFAKAAHPIPVLSKGSLLNDSDLALLQSLSWDVQGEVDYLVMRRSSRFLGMAQSSFSYAVAIARHANSTEGTCGSRTPGIAEASLERNLAFKDDFSVIVGRPNGYLTGSRMWP